jgi:hypothetical protein
MDGFGIDGRRVRLGMAGVLLLMASPLAFAAAGVGVPDAVTVGAGWQMQDVAKVPDAGAVVASAKYRPAGWYAATVPGTVLTTLVNDKVYPEPLYGDGMRPEHIPESLARTSYWYRTVVTVPKTYAGRHVWLNFDGINYAATVWVNGTQVGTMRGAFARGKFDISAVAKPGTKAVVAVLVAAQPHPGDPHEHTLAAGMGKNGGMTARDGPTFLSTIGWDWVPAVRDRDTGIWQKVYLSASGPVLLKDPLVTTDLPLPRIDSADVAVETTVENVTDQPVSGVVKGNIETIAFEQPVTVAAHSTQVVKFDSTTTPALHMANPRLWWPNGYGKQEMYTLHLAFEQQGVAQKSAISDVQDVAFGVRKIMYSVPDSDNLTISVNGVRVFIRGGDWGLDEAMKRIPRERLEAEIRMHALANMNMIRNWVGQSTSEDFYEMCDKYGILLWDEFFQANPSDGPNPDDLTSYVANVREKIVRFRNHPSIAVWCARNEGYPPTEINDALLALLKELEPTRLYQPSSTEGRGVKSGGPYRWRAPEDAYRVDAPFKTEIGSVSVPTVESIRGMMPEKDWEVINDDWAEHDFAKGASASNTYPATTAARYGAIANLADFARKAQMMNYEGYRAMYEGRNAALFHPATGILTWMSNPAQPSFVWQLYHYDLEPNASLYAVKKAGELVHIQYDEADGEVQVINNLPDAVTGATAHVAVIGLDGQTVIQHDYPVTAAADAAMSLGVFDWTSALAGTHFIKLELHDAAGKLLSQNLYWHAQASTPDDLTDLNKLPEVALEAQVARTDADGKTTVTVTLHNPGKDVALMAHLQLRRAKSGERVLPAYASDNYISLLGGESRTVTIEADAKDLRGEDALVVVDGWNVGVVAASAKGAAIAENVDAQVSHWPVTGLPFQTTGLR